MGDDAMIDLGPGEPDLALCPVEALGAAARRAWVGRGPACLHYGDNAGPPALRDWLTARWAVEDGSAADPGAVLVTAGATHALQMLCLRRAAPGAVVLVEAPTYDRALTLFREHGLEPVGVDTDYDGLIVEALEERLGRVRAAGRPVGFLYWQPSFQNPRGTLTSAARRTAILEIAERSDVLVVEDEAYRELPFAGEPPPSTWAIAGAASTVRVGSFSKTLGPGVRVGWLAGPSELVGELASCALLHSGGGIVPLMAEAILALALDGSYDAHVRELRRAYGERKAALRENLLATAPADVQCTAPVGGYFLWLTLRRPPTWEALNAALAAAGVALYPGSAFLGAPSTGTERHLRLCFSRNPPATLRVAGRSAGAVLAAQAAASSVSAVGAPTGAKV